MARFRDGQSAINNTYNSTPYDNVLGNLFSKIKTLDSNVVRVKSIILDSTHPRYNELGKENSIGTIIFDDNIELSNKSNNIESLPYAKPLNNNIKHYPLINELVAVFRFPSREIGKNTAIKQTYYTDIISIWNSPHHNAYPDIPNQQPLPQRKNYNESEIGSTSKIIDEQYEINLGATFKERSNIHPLLPFEGDVILEGRWGNSIRFGSTVQNKPNNWSSTGNNGDPIVILRNGQLSDASNEGWVPIVEDINKDISSIYLTSTQQIPIKVAQAIYNSYSEQPINPNQYPDKQIILNSGRLVFNSNKDHILLSSAQTIGFNAVKGFNFDTKSSFIIDAPLIKLGGKDATESILKGDTTIKLLSGLVNQLIALATALQSVTTPSGPAVAPAATQLIPYLTQLKAELETTTKSLISKTL
jgi:hypothetical protein